LYIIRQTTPSASMLTCRRQAADTPQTLQPLPWSTRKSFKKPEA